MDKHDRQILIAAHNVRQTAADFRNRRDRYKRYTYGDQWSDIVPDQNGKMLREDILITRSGKKPMTNNLIRRLVKAIVGRYRNISDEAAIYAPGSEIFDSVIKPNQLAELDSRLLEEFLISGCAIQRIVDERRFNGSGTWIDNVDPRRFFVNAFTDPRGWDIDLIGMLHDFSFPELLCRFAKGDAERIRQLNNIYRLTTNAAATFSSSAILALANPIADDFFCSTDSSKCRVIEVWTFDCSEPPQQDHENSPGQPVFTWHCRYYATDGTLLDSFDSPYAHASHPFAVKFYPLTDGEVHSFVEDIIDQQRYINRLVVTLDHILASSAKGVLLFPENQMIDNFSWEDIAKRWARSDSIIPISGQSEILPQQIVSPSANTGAYQLLALEMKLLEQISGVGDTLTGGHNISASMGAQMYDSQVKNATIALADLFKSFSAFIEDRNEKAKNCAPKKKNAI